MSDVAPPTRISSATPGQAKPIGLPGAITNPPPAITGLAIGTILRGVVQGRDNHGHVLVQTQHGALSVASAANLTSGSSVALQIRTAGSELLIAILQIDGHIAQGADTRPQAHIGQGNLALSTASPLSSASTALPEVVLAIGQTLRAVVRGPAGQGVAPSPDGANLPALTPGTRLQVKVLEIQTPTRTPPNSPNPQGAPAAQPTLGVAGDQARLPVGRLLIQSLVIGTAAKGQPVVQSPLGTLTLNLSAPLPSGTSLLLELAAADLDQSAGRTTRPAGRPVVALAYHWPALQEALQALPGNTGAAAQMLLLGPRGVPQPGPRLTSGILFFLQALAIGNLDGWLGGQAAEALERAGRGGLAPRLAQEFAQLSRLSETAGGEWRFFPIPLFDGSQVHQLRLFLRRRDTGHGGASGAEDEGGATRFVVDLEHSRLGALQLDGLVRERRFDLMLRSRQAFTEGMRRDITVIFGDATDAAGYGGQIGFQASEDWHAMPLEIKARDAEGLVV